MPPNSFLTEQGCYTRWSWNAADGLVPLAYDVGDDQFVIQYDKASTLIYFLRRECVAGFIIYSS